LENADRRRERTVDSSSAFLRASGGKDGQTEVDMFAIVYGLLFEKWNVEAAVITISGRISGR
jgi:hypothetical protein